MASAKNITLIAVACLALIILRLLITAKIQITNKYNEQYQNCINKNSVYDNSEIIELRNDCTANGGCFDSCASPRDLDNNDLSLGNIFQMYGSGLTLTVCVEKCYIP